MNLKTIGGMDTQLQLFDDSPLKEDKAEPIKYTSKVGGLIYEPRNAQPHVLECSDSEKTKRLIRDIERSSVDDMEKAFLIEAAHRHTVFNYAKIADYYAHATKEMQELMEKSALVIIDFDKSIENGFTKLQDDIHKEWEKEQIRRRCDEKE